MSRVCFTSSFIFSDTWCPPFWLYPQCLPTLPDSERAAGCQRPGQAQWLATERAPGLPPPASVGPEAASGRPQGPECVVQGAVTNEGASPVTALSVFVHRLFQPLTKGAGVPKVGQCSERVLPGGGNSSG